LKDNEAGSPFARTNRHSMNSTQQLSFRRQSSGSPTKNNAAMDAYKTRQRLKQLAPF